ncbi:MAG: hypothetical protein M1812_003888 [Candelaria pacifica]|nr:MAG: hypothetical protein M1812_003888 [Candelaria pacifica]
MSAVPFKSIAISSQAASLLLVYYAPQYTLTRAYISTAVQLFFFQLLLWATWMVIIKPRYFSSIRHLPQPTGNSFFMGQFGRILADPTGSPHRDWVNEIPNDGVIRYLGMFNSERIMPTNPKAFSEVLTLKSYDFQKPKLLRSGLGRILGIGILLAEGDEHKAQRKNLMPAFAYRHVKDLYPIFWSKAAEVTQAMTKKVQDTDSATDEKTPDSSVLEVADWCSRATLDIIGVAGLGHDFGVIQNPETELNQAYQKIFKPSRQAQILGILNLMFPEWIVLRLPMKRNDLIEESAEMIKKTCRLLIREKKTKLENKEAKGADILSVALESGGFTEEGLVNQLMTFLAAGHETTASGTTWAIYLLCKHPEIQKRLRREVRANLPSINDQEKGITANQIDSLPFLHAVCNEVLRLYPPVPGLVRETARETTIVGHPIPKGTRVMLVPWAINHSKALWGADASEFVPDRWMGAGKANSGGAESNYAYMTFLHGPRSCIGQGFAKAEFACLVAAIVGRFEMELENPEIVPVIKGGVTARPKGGLNVRMKPLDGW